MSFGELKWLRRGHRRKMVCKAPAWQVEGDGMAGLSVRGVFEDGSEAGPGQVGQQECFATLACVV
jgi:hypothetical protein